jgi:hypothetical protein
MKSHMNAAAKAALKEVPKGRPLTVENVMTLIAADLAAMSGPSLVTAYNLLSPEKPVTRFATPEDGRKRLALKIEARKLAAKLAAGETAEEAKAKVTAKGKEQVAAVLASGEKMDKRLAKLNGIATATGPNVAKPKKTPVGRIPKEDRSPGSRITILVKNPARPGTAHFARFNLYRNGMTVGEYIAAGGHSGDVYAWDLPHGFISLSDPK